MHRHEVVLNPIIWLMAEAIDTLRENTKIKTKKA